MATIRPPIASTFASLCSRDSRAVYRSLQSAARAPSTLLAAICSPWPLPPSTMPRSARPSATCSRDIGTNRRIVHRRRLVVGAAIVDDVAEPLQRSNQVLLQREARVVGADRDAHRMRLYRPCHAGRGGRAGGAEPNRGYPGPGTRNPEPEPEPEPGTRNPEPGTRNPEPRMSTVTISQRGEERSRTGHPWIYKSDIAKVEATGGDTVTVMGARGRAIGQALYSDRSEIALRMLTHGAQPRGCGAVDRAAGPGGRLPPIALRSTQPRTASSTAKPIACRRSSSIATATTWSSRRCRRAQIGCCRTSRRQLVELLHPAGILARNDPRVRLLEGLEQRVEVLYGTVPETVEVREGRRRVPGRSRTTGRRPGCSSISARTGSPRPATPVDACSTPSATTAALPWRWPRAAPRCSRSTSRTTRSRGSRANARAQRPGAMCRRAP